MGAYEPWEGAGELERLELIATRIRKTALEYITKSGSGHPGGSASIADILAVLYFGRVRSSGEEPWIPIMRYDPAEPLWEDRDRFLLGKGHAAPALYAALAEAGFFSREHFKIYRKIDCPLEGHPVMCRLFEGGQAISRHGIEGVDFPSGSLGHGLSGAAGMALHAKVYGLGYDVFVLLGDGDMQEGMTWEACMTIPNKGLNNVCAVIDYNRLQVDGRVDQINRLEPLAEKLRAFNWEVREINGHDFSAILEVLREFKTARTPETKPFMIVAHTVKGKGAEEIENDYRYHALPLSLEQYARAEKAFDEKIRTLEEQLALRGTRALRLKPIVKPPETETAQQLSEIIRRNPIREYTEPTATRIGYGNALARLGEYEKIFVLNADLAGACGTSKYLERYGESAADPRSGRSVNVGVQECNMMTMGAAFAACGKIPIVNSFGVFSTGRAWEMVRQDVSYPNLNVKIIGSHAGIALGEYGVTHQSIADVAVMRVLPNLTVIEPSDAIQADLLFEKILAHEGPVYFRLGRNPTPLIYSPQNPWGVKPRTDFEIGKGYLLRPGTDLTLIASGPIACQALMAAINVRESVRVIDMPSVKPLDRGIIEAAAKETGWVCTLQDHLETGGLRDAVAVALLSMGLSVRFDSIALEGFAESGSAADLYEKYGLSSSRIIEKLGLTPRN